MPLVLPYLITLLCSLLLMIFMWHAILYDWTEIQNHFWKAKTNTMTIRVVIHFSRVAALDTIRCRIWRGKAREISPPSTWALQECCSTLALKKQTESTATNKQNIPCPSVILLFQLANYHYHGAHVQDHRVKLWLSSPSKPTEKECKTLSHWRAADFLKPVITKNQEKHLTSQPQSKLHFGFFKNLQI